MPARSASPSPTAAEAGRGLEVALWLASRGLPVHPLAPGSKTPAANCIRCREEPHAPSGCPCPVNGLWCHGFHAATTDTALIRDWWTEQPRFGVGVSCGPAGLVVLDVDTHPAPLPDRARLLPGIPIDDRVDLTGLSTGYDTLALLAAHRGRPDPALDESTLRVRTPTGGMHIWYRAPLGSPPIRSSSGTGTRTALAWQVDVRATGGYIVAPGTRTAHGAYEALPGARTPAPLPLWLHAELARTGHHPAPAPVPASAPRTRRTVPPRRADAAHRILGPLLDEVRGCAHAPSGTAFSDKLNRAAFTAGGLAAAGHITLPECAALLTEAAHTARPAQPRRNQLVIDSALRAGSHRPIHPEGRS
ncbi:bifunctional DNA primase/polymerase [Streptomyces sp. NPDC058157]|uniref:bifunctional DNA primase/polymerase n=1 Tax=Streptomyces sp. NPDC058157 TaxID=3346360 RepID=UPI0036EEB0AB